MKHILREPKIESPSTYYCPNLGLVDTRLYDFVINFDIRATKISKPVLKLVLKFQNRRKLKTGVLKKSVFWIPYNCLMIQ